MLKKSTSIILQVVIWLALFLFLFTMGLKFNTAPISLFKASTNVLLLILMAFVNRKILIPKLFNSKKIAFYFVFVIALLILYIFIVKSLIFSNTTDIKITIEHLKSGNIKITNAWMLLKLVSIILCTGVLFASTVSALIKEIYLHDKQKLEIEIERKTAELKLVNTQFSPHFFLNSLNNLYSISKLKPQKTGVFIQRLTSLMQYLTYEQMNDKVLLKKEIDFIADYIFFQQEKGDDLFDVTMDFENMDSSLPIAPRILIPFVENAFKFAYQPSQTKCIMVQLKTIKNTLKFVVKNDISTLPRQRKEDGYFGVGIDSVKKMLENLYPEKHELTIIKKDNTYTVELTIKLKDE